jgi:hypothetical protein
MFDSNSKASEFIKEIELYCDNLLQKLHDSEYLVTQARLEAQAALTKAEEAQNSLKELQEAQETRIATEKVASENSTSNSENNIIDTIINITNDITDTIKHDKEILELQEHISTLQSQNQLLKQQCHKTFQSLQKEMLKVDTMQMELELLQRERDIALRKQSLSPEQKQLLVKLEYENYKIHETIERIDYISDTLRKILGEDHKDDTDIKKTKKINESEKQNTELPA